MDIILEIFVIDLGLLKHLSDCGARVGPFLSFGEGFTHIKHIGQTFKVLFRDRIEGSDVKALFGYFICGGFVYY